MDFSMEGPFSSTIVALSGGSTGVENARAPKPNAGLREPKV